MQVERWCRGLHHLSIERWCKLKGGAEGCTTFQLKGGAGGCTTFQHRDGLTYAGGTRPCSGGRTHMIAYPFGPLGASHRPWIQPLGMTNRGPMWDLDHVERRCKWLHHLSTQGRSHICRGDSAIRWGADPHDSLSSRTPWGLS